MTISAKCSLKANLILIKCSECGDFWRATIDPTMHFYCKCKESATIISFPEIGGADK